MYGRLAWDVLRETAMHNRVIIDRIDLTDCVMLKPYAVACLAALGAKRPGQIELVLPQDAACAEHLARMELPQWFRCDRAPGVATRGTNVVARQLKEHPGVFSDEVINVLSKELSLSVNIGRELSTHLDEVIINALTHAKSPIGCMVVGQAFPSFRRMQVAILDLGQTIRGHLRANPAHATITDDEAAILLATQEGVSGTPAGAKNSWGEDNAGLGLFELRRYCEAGGGILTIVSGSVFLTFDAARAPITHKLSEPFQGCLVNVQFFDR